MISSESRVTASMSIKPGLTFINYHERVADLPGGKAGILPAGFERRVVEVKGNQARVKATQAHDTDGFWMMSDSLENIVRTSKVVKWQ